MGDRANIVVMQHEGRSPPCAIFFYAHSGGWKLARTLRDALKRGEDRWDDESYLGRIIFNEMTKGEELDTQGFGVSTYLGDNEYPLLVVDAERKIVGVAPEGPLLKVPIDWKKVPVGKATPFAKFAAFSDRECDRFRGGKGASDEDEDEDADVEEEKPAASAKPEAPGAMILRPPPGSSRLPDNGEWTNRFEIKSESSDRVYVVSQHKTKRHWGCSCPGWRSRRTCKHLGALMLPAHEVPHEVRLVK